MKRLSKSCSRWGSKRSGVVHVSDAKFASLYEETDLDVVNDDDDKRQPEKTLRMLSSSKLDGFNQQQQKMFLCNKCGKGFQSSKALCGHMACHSVKDKTLRKKKKLMIMDSQSETESGARRRSRRAKCKKFDVPVVNSMSKLDGYSYSNCSSEASGVEQEQEDVAIGLMMLSRDTGNWNGLNSIGDSSEDNSVVFEARSVSTNLLKKDGLRRSKYDVDETLGDSGCGYVRNGAKTFVTDVKFDDSRKNKRDKGSNAEQNDNLKMFQSNKKPKKTKLYSRMNAEIYQSNKAVNENVARNHKSFKRSTARYESSTNSSETDGSHTVDDYGKMGNEHECPICFKIFKSVQALGRHRRVHLAERSDTIINKCDEVSASFKGNEAQLHGLIDLNLPAPMEDEDTS